jgi:hypothetical protein
MRKAHNIAVGLYVLYRIFLNDFIPDHIQKLSLTVTAVVGIVLILSSLFFLFYDGERRTLKTFDTLTSMKNGGNYLQVWLLLFITNLDAIHPFGTISYLIVSLSLLLFCILTVIKDAIINRTFITAVILGHVFFGYCMYTWSKGTYTRKYGKEIIGNFFEKPEYKAKYLVKLYREGQDQVYTLPALLHIFSESFEDDYGDGYQSWTERYIMVEKVYFRNGGYLNFNDCDLNEGKRVYCLDQDDNGWYIELTKERIE